MGVITKATLTINNASYEIDLSKPLDLSLPLKSGDENPHAWYIDNPSITPVVLDNWIGSVQEGASTNFNNIYFNPHAHGTHTECVGHITKGFYSVNESLQTFFFLAELISITPEKQGDDWVITKQQLRAVLTTNPEAIVIRTLPNSEVKKTQKYSHSNPPYLTEEAAIYLREIGVQHLLIDLPSVDKEEDGGALLAHKAFWNISENIRTTATITEFVYVPDEVKDGVYVLNLQIAPFHNDASPSKPILYKLI